MELEHVTIFASVIVVGFGILLVVSVPTLNPFAEAPHMAPLDFNTPTPIPTHAPPIKTPTASPTYPQQPTPQPSPEATAVLGRWCDDKGVCHDGVPPTPTPTPEPTPTVEPCLRNYIPPELSWQSFHPCYCALREKWGLGPYLSLAEACHRAPPYAWQEDACECLELLVKGG